MTFKLTMLLHYNEILHLITMHILYYNHVRSRSKRAKRTCIYIVLYL
jgi:hypothetical protein